VWLGIGVRDSGGEVVLLLRHKLKVNSEKCPPKADQPVAEKIMIKKFYIGSSFLVIHY